MNKILRGWSIINAVIILIVFGFMGLYGSPTILELRSKGELFTEISSLGVQVYSAHWVYYIGIGLFFAVVTIIKDRYMKGIYSIIGNILVIIFIIVSIGFNNALLFTPCR